MATQNLEFAFFPSRLNRLEPLVPLALSLHGSVMLLYQGGETWQWFVLGGVALLGILGLLNWPEFSQVILLRPGCLVVITWLLMLTTGGTASFFLLWYFVLIPIYTLLLAPPYAIALPGIVAVAYLFLLPFSSSQVPLVVIIARVFLLAFLGWLAHGLGSIIASRTRERQQDEQRLQHQASLLQNVSDAIIATDTNFNIQSWNKAAELIYGWPSNEVMGKRMSEVVPTAYPQGRAEEVRAQFLAKGFWQGEVVQTRKNGTTVDIQASVSMITNSAGQPIGFVAVNRDITKYKQAEQARQRYADRLKVLHEIDQAILTTRSPAAIADAALLHLQRLMPYRQSSVALFDFEANAASLLAAQGADQKMRPGARLPLKLFGRLEKLQQGQIQIFEDTVALARPPAPVQTVSGLRAPLLAQGALIGSLNLRFNRPGSVTPEYIEIAREVAAQLAIAIQHARLFEQVQRHAAELEQKVTERAAQLEQQYRRQAALAEIELAINQPHELQAALNRIAEVATETLPASGGVSVILWDAETETFFISASTVPGQAPQTAAQRVRLQGGATRWIVEHRQPCIVPNIHDDPFGANQMLTEFDIQAYAGLPLLDDGQVVGVLYALDRQPRHYEKEDLDFLTALAGRAAVAITKVRLYEQAQALAALGERQRLARELHDVVSQSLFSASVIAETLPRLWERDPEAVKRSLADLHRLTRGALAEMRTLLLELRPASLAEVELEDLLRQLVEALGGRTRMAVSLRVSGHHVLPLEVKIALFRIAQETLNNIAKHARARRVLATLCDRPAAASEGRQGGLILQVCDDGRGFDRQQISPGRLGLSIMQERAETIGARLKVASLPGYGTVMIVIWPGLQGD